MRRLCHAGYVWFLTLIAFVLDALRLEALRLRLKQIEHFALAREAHRQSLRARTAITEDESFWEARADTTGWK
jgi:hypothetical protein